MIFKRPGSQYFWMKFIFNGKLVQKSTKVENARIAADIERSYRVQLARGEVGLEEKKAPRTVQELLNDLERDFVRRGKGTVPNLNLIKKVGSDFGNKRPDQLTEETLRDYIDRRQSGKKPSPASTLNHVTQTLSSAYKLAKLPFPKIPKLSEVGRERSGFVSKDEINRVISHLRTCATTYGLRF